MLLWSELLYIQLLANFGHAVRFRTSTGFGFAFKTEIYRKHSFFDS
jgi:hypothetical protein